MSARDGMKRSLACWGQIGCMFCSSGGLFSLTLPPGYDTIVAVAYAYGSSPLLLPSQNGLVPSIYQQSETKPEWLWGGFLASLTGVKPEVAKVVADPIRMLRQSSRAG